MRRVRGVIIEKIFIGLFHVSEHVDHFACILNGSCLLEVLYFYIA
jgi:hypothetical protein